MKRGFLKKAEAKKASAKKREQKSLVQGPDEQRVHPAFKEEEIVHSKFFIAVISIKDITLMGIRS